MSENLIKSLTDLIDETLSEIEDLKKSRFDTSTIELGDDKANGSMDTKSVNKAEDDKDDKKEDKKEDKEEDKKEDKKDDKKEDKKEDKEEDKKEDKKDGKPDFLKSDDEDEDDEDEEDDEEVAKAEAALKLAKEGCAMRKAEKKKGINVEKMEEVKKSLDARISPIEAQLTQLTDLVKKLADMPVGQRGASFKDIKPLAKSDETTTLSKSMILDKLVDLKKSGQNVLTDDIINAEVGSLEDTSRIANKYGIK